MLAVARTFSLLAIEAYPVAVEVDVHRGLPAFSIVGLPDAAVRESRERVRAAIVNSGFQFPLQRITANLAPADLRKVGPGFDLAIAAAVLIASGQMPGEPLGRVALAGELALDGAIRSTPGALAMAERARGDGLAAIAVAPQDAAEASLIDDLDVLPLGHLRELAAIADGELPSFEAPPAPAQNGALPDLAELRGQPGLARALEVAAAGGHSLLMLGPPGAGKSLAARRLPSLLPPLERGEALEATRIASACGRREQRGTLATRPFRAPHHTVSAAGLIGGGAPPRPGEVTLAHRGVLFLDELGEFHRPTLEALRQPLEDGSVTLTRGGRTVELPCRFMLVAASNPCPCGRGVESGECRCSIAAAERYKAKLSGALADRIDITVTVEQPPAGTLGEQGESSGAVRERVAAARERQAARLGPGRCNSELSVAELERFTPMTDDATALLESSHRKLGLSGRGWDRVRRVARTIADLDGGERIGEDHIGEAVSLRRRDRDR